MIEEAEKAIAQPDSTVEERVAKGETYINAEGQEVKLEEAEISEPQIDTVYSEEDGSKKKTYMTKDPTGKIQVIDLK
jgi:hypothetical protein